MSSKNMQKEAEAAVKAAEATPFTWQGKSDTDQVLFDGEVYTVADNGDAQDFETRQAAIAALAYQWSKK